MATPHHTAAPVLHGPALRRAEGRRRRRTAVALLVAVLLVGLLGLVRTHVVGPVRIASTSMEPTLFAGDVVLVDRRPVQAETLARGDLVTFRDVRDGTETLKRVVGLPGERVSIVDSVLHVDGAPVSEPYVVDPDDEGMFNAQVVVPADSVYVLGDNRLVSVDSRDYGPVPEANLDGRVTVRIWPLVRSGGD
ncbi:signal peptidase I [Cellulomonas aerilata]|uniref:Signal peptidase I n=1 Tax=Cellulomonas aerilata TaxID=515326 RepID=A0A512DBM3_9CELL|nr:signal peptidase I [Cellulomonas aerilata]GEO33879.1 signal peptidase I [Cellulomonas aerilata]